MCFKVCSTDKVAQQNLENRSATLKEVFTFRSFQDIKDICQAMPSTCANLLWLSEHASLTRGYSAPTQTLDEADDAGLTPANSCAVHSGEGRYAIQGCPEQRSLVVVSTNFHVLCVSWICPPGYSFHGAQRQQAGVF